MKKIVFEIIQVIIAYVIITIYGYYNSPEPDNKYSWLISAIMVITIYLIIKLVSKKINNTILWECIYRKIKDRYTLF